MKFIKGELYKVVKVQHAMWFTNCAGCILKCLGKDTKENIYWAKPIKPLKNCESTERCLIIEWSRLSNDIRLKRYIGMVEFCKKLKKERDNDKQRNKRST